MRRETANFPAMGLLLLLALFAAMPATARIPLEGKWRSLSGGDDLTLRGDSSFTWGKRQGEWYPSGGMLYLHSPGVFVSYQPQLEGTVLVLTGGDLRGGEARFRYASPGEPVPLHVPPPPQSAEEQMQKIKAEKDDNSSLSARFSDLAPGPICGTWVALNRIGRNDTLRFHASGELVLEGGDRRSYLLEENRIYVIGNGNVEEWFFQKRGPVMAVSYDPLSSPRGFVRIIDSSLIYFPYDLGKVTGIYRRTLSATDGGGMEILAVSEGNRLSCSRVSAEGDTTLRWSGYGSPVGMKLQIRYDNGDLWTVDANIEDSPKFGRLLELDGMVYLQDAKPPVEIDTSLRMDPTDAARLMRDLSDVLDKTEKLIQPILQSSGIQEN